MPVYEKEAFHPFKLEAQFIPSIIVLLLYDCPLGIQLNTYPLN
jgi:hypothetical protein